MGIKGLKTVQQSRKGLRSGTRVVGRKTYARTETTFPFLRHAEAHHTVTGGRWVTLSQFRASEAATRPLLAAPAAQAHRRQNGVRAIDGETITGPRGIKSNCVADLSFIKDFSQLTFSRCDAVKMKPTTELFEKVMFKLSRVPRWLPLHYELTFATLWDGAARPPAWTCAAWRELGLSSSIMSHVFEWINK